VRSAAVLVAGLLCGLAAQGLLRPRALQARQCWPPDSAQSMGWKSAAPIVGRELTADLLWAKVLVYYGGARMNQGGYLLGRERPLVCGPRPAKLKVVAANALGLPVADPGQARLPNVEPRCAPCGAAHDRPDFRYLEPMLDALFDTDPGFKRVYRWAAFAVTYKEEQPTQEEFQLSLKYLDRAMAEYPDDPEYLWLAGTRYFLDLKPADEKLRQQYREKGVELIESAMRKPNAPRSYTELAAAFNTKLGRQQRALRNLEETILTVESPEARAKLIEKLRLYEADDLADELEAVTRDLETRWKATLPYAPPSLYFILGDRPSPVIDFDQLATERDLFGSDAEEPTAP
jgi:hypothetical protein